MDIHLTAHVDAPIDEVFGFFDDPANALDFNVHAVRQDVVAVQPDGRRTVDIVMRAGAKEWMQTIEQVVRQPPSKLVTLGGSWTTDRDHRLLTITTDRRFSTDGDGTRVEWRIESRLEHPWRRPLQVVVNWFARNATQRVFEGQIDALARRIEERHAGR